MVYRQSPHQLSFESFGCGLSTPLSPNNEWVRLADIFPCLNFQVKCNDDNESLIVV